MGILKGDDTMGQGGGYNAILDQGTEFEGKLTFEGTVRIDGSFKGEVFSDATLIVGETGKVQADIRVRHVVVSGEVNGNIEGTEKIELLSPAVVRGTLKTPNLTIDEGVVFEGNCNMMEGGKKPTSKTKTAKEDADHSTAAVALSE